MYFAFLFTVVTTIITCSYAFMLPVATAPNALVFQAGTMRNTYMMFIGFVMNWICIITTNIAINTYAETFFSVDFDKIPDWARAEAGAEELIKNCTLMNN